MKKRISIFMICTLLVMTFTVPVYASNVDQNEHPYFDDFYKFVQVIEDFGMAANYLPAKVLSTFIDFKTEKNLDVPANTIDDVYTFMNSGTIVNGENITFNPQVTDWIKYFTNEIEEEQRYYYGYTRSVNYLDLKNATDTVRQLLLEYQGTHYVEYDNSNGNYFYMSFSPIGTTKLYLNLIQDGQFNTVTNQVNITGNKITYEIDKVNNTIRNNGYIENASYGVPYWFSNSNTEYMNNKHYMISTEPIGYYIFSDGYNGDGLPYYTTSDYSTNSTIEGSYNTTQSNVGNTVSYNTINNYFNTTTQSTGTPPSPQDIQIHIENIQNNNQGGNGGGSGGNGNGSGETNIFDFLSDLGAVLGNLIKNLGKALTELIQGISEVITGLVESIPIVFSDFLGAVIGWMPTELRALLSLFISAMVIVGLVKLFKG